MLNKHQRIVIINGPNLNLLGKREPELYGHISFDDYYSKLLLDFPNVDLIYFQTNHEGLIIDKLQEFGFTADGIVLNAAGYTHSSIAIADTIRAIETPVVEVHISDIYQREEFRKISFMKDACVLSIVGKGLEGYKEAISFLVKN